MPTTVFLSYARGDDEPFVARLYADLSSRGFDVWWDRVSMPSRGLTFLHEIREAVDVRERFVLVVGPKAVSSEYVIAEWQHAVTYGKAINPILRLGEISLVPDELKLIHLEDFRDDGRYPFHLDNLVRQLSEPVAPMGKLIGVPSLPRHLLSRSDRLRDLKDALLIDLRRPVVVIGAATRLGVHGMGGIGKSVLANLLVRDTQVRRAFPDGIVWVPIGTNPDVMAIQRNVASLFDDPGYLQTVEQGRARLGELLSSKAVLLVLDDVWQREHAEAFGSFGPRCRVLITTRDAGLVTSLGGTQVQVPLLTPAESQRLLAGAAAVELDELPLEAAEVGKECGHLPLALALCGGLFRRGVDWTAILQRLRQTALDSIADRNAENAQHRSIWIAMKVSVDALAPDEQQRFIELSVFPAGLAVPDAAVQTLWTHTGAVSHFAAEDLLIGLRERSLIRFDTEASPAGPPIRRVSLHDLLHGFVTKAAGDPTLGHRRLLDAYLAHCPTGWSSGPDDGYYFENATAHVIQAQDVALSRQFLRSGFLEKKARLLGDIAAMSDARALAEAMAAAGERHWDDLLACAHAYCTYAEQVRAAPEALETLARADKIDQLTRALEVETDPRRRAALSLAAAALLREAGHAEHADEVWRRGTDLWSQAPASNDDSTDVLVRGLLNAWQATPAYPTSARRVLEVGTVIAPTAEPRQWISKGHSLLLAMTSREQGLHWGVGFGVLMLLTVMPLMVLFFQMFGMVTPGQSSSSPVLVGGGFVISWSAVFLIPMYLVVRAGPRLREPGHPGIEREMNELLSACCQAQGARRARFVLRALRFHELIQNHDASPAWRPWEPLLSQLAVCEFGPDVAPPQAAIWLIVAAELGGSVADALSETARAAPVPWLTELLRQAIRLHGRWGHRTETLRLVADLTQAVADPGLLLDLLHGELPRHSKPAENQSLLDLSARSQVDFLSAMSPAHLARTIIASVHDRPRRRHLLGRVLSVVNPFGFVKVPLSPLERLWLLPVLLMVTFPFMLCTVFLVTILVFAFGMFGAVAVVARRYDPYGLTTIDVLDNSESFRRRLLDRLAPALRWGRDYIRTRLCLSVLVAQSVLRNEYVDLYNVPKGCIRRAFRLLSRQRLLGSRDELLLHVMDNRRLISLVARMRSSSRGAGGTARLPDPARDRPDLLRIVPVEPARRSLRLSLLLFLALSTAFLIVFALLAPPGRAHNVVHRLILGSLVGVGLCIAQHCANPGLDEDRDDINTVSDHSASMFFTLFGSLTITLVFEAWLQRPGFHEGSSTREQMQAMFEVFLWVVVYPLGLANLVVPEVIARWRGVGLLYPTMSDLAIRRAGCIVLGFAIPLVFAWLATQCL